jgi:hypothetical protein
MWGQMFDAFGVLPGLREGIGHIQDDERRHIAYGTYLCRRIIAADPALAEFGVDKMYELRNLYAGGFAGLRTDNGLSRASAEEVIKAARAAQEAAQANGGSGGGYGGGPGQFSVFAEVMLRQVDRRIALLRNAAKLDAKSAELGTGAEEVEEELEKVS